MNLLRERHTIDRDDGCAVVLINFTRFMVVAIQTIKLFFALSLSFS